MNLDRQDTLELSEFISQTLVQIVKGVELARNELKSIDTNAEICPTGLKFEKGSSPAPFKPDRGFVQEVEFNVAVTVNKESATKGSGEINLSIGVPSITWLPGAKAGGDLVFE